MRSWEVSVAVSCQNHQDFRQFAVRKRKVVRMHVAVGESAANRGLAADSSRSAIRKNGSRRSAVSNQRSERMAVGGQREACDESAYYRKDGSRRSRLGRGFSIRIRRREYKKSRSGDRSYRKNGGRDRAVRIALQKRDFGR